MLLLLLWSVLFTFTMHLHSNVVCAHYRRLNTHAYTGQNRKTIQTRHFSENRYIYLLRIILRFHAASIANRSIFDASLSFIHTQHLSNYSKITIKWILICYDGVHIVNSFKYCNAVRENMYIIEFTTLLIPTSNGQLEYRYRIVCPVVHCYFSGTHRWSSVSPLVLSSHWRSKNDINS